MRLLLLNTCGAEGSMALADTELSEPILVLSRMPGRTASERLVAAIRQAMADASWKPRDLAAISVVTGPGSFTGVRVGLSVAKGLSEASGVPLIALSRLALLAAAATPVGGERVCALLDAGRSEVYCGAYLQSSESVKPDLEALDSCERLMSIAEVTVAVSNSNAVVVCEEAVVKALGDAVTLQVVAEPTGADALPLALQRLAETSFDDLITLDANYLRRTDVEIFAKPAARRER